MNNKYIDFKRNITGDSIEFSGVTDKDKYHEEGRYVIGNLKAKLEDYMPVENFESNFRYS